MAAARPACPYKHPVLSLVRPCSPDQRAQIISLRGIFLRRMTKVGTRGSLVL